MLSSFLAFFMTVLLTYTLLTSAHAQQSGHALPKCVSSEADLATVAASIKANPKDPKKYDGYRSVLEKASASELLARISYAETIAANCPLLEPRILPLITESIVTRVRIRKGDVKSVVFQRDQHSSSMNIYLESRFRDFLCPKDAELWSAAEALADSHLKALATLGRLPADATHYYLYNHSKRLNLPDWAGDNGVWPIVDLGAPDATDLRPCIRFFRDSKWR